MTAREVGKDRGDVGAMRKIRMVANGGHGSSGCPGPPNEDKERAANNKNIATLSDVSRGQRFFLRGADHKPTVITAKIIGHR